MKIPAEAIEAAAEAVHLIKHPGCFGCDKQPAWTAARTAVEAAMPAIREALAQEIEGSPADEWPGGTISVVVAHAARIVRGGTA